MTTDRPPRVLEWEPDNLSTLRQLNPMAKIVGAGSIAALTYTLLLCRQLELARLVLIIEIPTFFIAFAILAMPGIQRVFSRRMLAVLTATALIHGFFVSLCFAIWSKSSLVRHGHGLDFVVGIAVLLVEVPVLHPILLRATRSEVPRK
jgi:hypothetical protein